jgi:hypothetical protein
MHGSEAPLSISLLVCYRRAVVSSAEAQSSELSASRRTSSENELTEGRDDHGSPTARIDA